jgi:hypothetical protein
MSADYGVFALWALVNVENAANFTENSEIIKKNPPLHISTLANQLLEGALPEGTVPDIRRQGQSYVETLNLSTREIFFWNSIYLQRLMLIEKRQEF